MMPRSAASPLRRSDRVVLSFRPVISAISWCGRPTTWWSTTALRCGSLSRNSLRLHMARSADSVAMAAGSSFATDRSRSTPVTSGRLERDRARLRHRLRAIVHTQAPQLQVPDPVSVVAVQRPVRTDEGLLRDVLGIVRISGELNRTRIDAILQQAYQIGEGAVGVVGEA